MNLISMAALAASISLLAGCNRTSDQGGTSPSSVTGTSRDSQTRVAPTAPPLPAEPGADINSKPGPSPSEQAVNKPADNTGKNVRDRSDAAVTPGDQSEAKPDLELTRQIRRAITDTSQLSTTAKNIKIMTENGKVTLRGPVNTAGERDQIAQIVQGTPGVSSVDNQLEVKNKE